MLGGSEMEANGTAIGLPDRGPGPLFGSTWIKQILVAADGSPASVEGLKQVANLAAGIGAKVIVVYVRHFPGSALMASGGGDPLLVEALDEQESEVRQEVLRFVGGTGVTYELMVRVGSPGEEIVKVADETGADLVVVGSNRHSSLHNLLLGSTAAYLATHSRVPVLVMRSRVASAAAQVAIR
jgi:nucleotide-binding universal stress UspA family protein